MAAASAALESLSCAWAVTTSCWSVVITPCAAASAVCRAICAPDTDAWPLAMLSLSAVRAGPSWARAALAALSLWAWAVLFGPPESWASFACAAFSACCAWPSAALAFSGSRLASTVPAGTFCPAWTLTAWTWPLVPKSRSVSLDGWSVPVTSTVWVTVPRTAGRVTKAGADGPRRAMMTPITMAPASTRAVGISQRRSRRRATSVPPGETAGSRCMRSRT